jgi:hypothetical protein
VVTRDKVYDLAFLPILQGALESSEITSTPSAEELLEVVHFLPSKPGSIKPVITRFFLRHFRTLCLRKKKEFSTTTAREPAMAGTTTRTSSRETKAGSEERGLPLL